MTDSTRPLFVLLPTSLFALALTLGALLLGASAAHAALRDHTVRWAPSTTLGVSRYVLSLGTAPGVYSAQLDLGHPTAAGGQMESLIEVEDSVDLYVSLRAENGAGFSDYSNEVVIAKILPPPPPPPTWGVTAITGISGTVSGAASVGASVLAGTQSVRFEIDGATVGVANGPPFTLGFDSTLLADGAHVVSATGFAQAHAAGVAGANASAPFSVDNTTSGGGGGGGIGGGGGGSPPVTGHVGVLVDAAHALQLVSTTGALTPLATPPAPNTDVRAAWCDFNGDGEQDVALGFGPGSLGLVRVLLLENDAVIDTHTIDAGRSRVQVSYKKAQFYADVNGETHPACGDIDGDGANELVVGLGAGGFLKVHAFDDLSTGFHEYMATERGFLDPIAFGGFGDADGRAIPAVGDVDGDGRDEIVIGRGAGGSGGISVFDDATTNFAALHTSLWFAFGTAPVMVPALDSGSPDGTAVPAVGDLDGDGRDEILIGLGTGSEARLFVLDDALASYAPIPISGSTDGSFQVGWAGYVSGDGRTLPCVADIDGDGLSEVGIGFGPGGEGRMQVLDDMTTGFAPHPDIGDPNGVVDTLDAHQLAPALRISIGAP